MRTDVGRSAASRSSPPTAAPAVIATYGLMTTTVSISGVGAGAALIGAGNQVPNGTRTALRTMGHAIFAITAGMTAVDVTGALAGATAVALHTATS